MGCSKNWGTVGAIMYADDLVLMAPSVYELQCMLKFCEKELLLLDLKLNVKKSKALRIGKRFKSKTARLKLSDGHVAWTNETKKKYLGIVILSAAKFKCCFDSAKTKFYRGANAILSKLSGKPNVTVTLHLIATIALPSLTYGIECLALNKTELKSLNYPWHKCMCRIFRTFDDEIITVCQIILGYAPLSNIYEHRAKMFLAKIRNCDNLMLRELADVHA
jgi:hypothetical protein